MLRRNASYNSVLRPRYAAHFLYITRFSRAHFHHENFGILRHIFHRQRKPHRSVEISDGFVRSVFFRKDFCKIAFHRGFCVAARHADHHGARLLYDLCGFFYERFFNRRFKRRRQKKRQHQIRERHEGKRNRGRIKRVAECDEKQSALRRGYNRFGDHQPRPTLGKTERFQKLRPIFQRQSGEKCGERQNDCGQKMR